MLNRLRTMALLLCCSAWAGCGSSSASPCEQAGELICQKACDCGKTRCAINQSAGAQGTHAFDDLEGCTDLYVKLGCMGGGKPSIDHSACLDALSSAQCASSTLGEALALPSECSEP